MMAWATSHMLTDLLRILPAGAAAVLLLSLFSKAGRSSTDVQRQQSGLYRILGAAVLLGIAGIPRTHLEMRLPPQQFQTADGGMLRLNDFAGRPVVVNLWATWCAPCLREMPTLRKAQAASPQAVFVFADQGESAASVADYLAHAREGTDNVVLDEQKDLARMAGSAVIPTTLFFDQEGKLRLLKAGALSESAFRDALASVSH
jgi:thiol-disulfide isomerase/thioredoxin